MEWTMEQCRRLATDLLDTHTVRWAHVQAVAAAAHDIVACAQLSDIVVRAAWLHDIGYAESVEQTGMHALDGAAHLDALGAPAELVSLVAYHSGAQFEAVQRGLNEPLCRLARPDQVNLDALTLADMTRGVTGEPVSVEERLEEILARYPTAHPVHRAVLQSRAYLTRCAERAEQRYALSR